MLAAYIRKHFRNYNFHIYAGDPALRIFRRERLPSKKLTRMNINRVISAHREDFALLGTGRPVSLELAALKEIKRHHMMAAAYIDSWTNYRERFGYPRSGWQRNLPKEIWTGDSSALALAKQYFRTIRIRFVPNQYFANVVSTYRARARRPQKSPGILYTCAAGRHSAPSSGRAWHRRGRTRRCRRRSMQRIKPGWESGGVSQVFPHQVGVRKTLAPFRRAGVAAASRRTARK